MDLHALDLHQRRNQKKDDLILKVGELQNLTCFCFICEIKNKFYRFNYIELFNINVTNTNWLHLKKITLSTLSFCSSKVKYRFISHFCLWK